jgi:plasmid stabilization system protein ParE
MNTTYSIEITQKAEVDVDTIFSYLSFERPTSAAMFIVQFEKHVRDLRRSPARYPKIRERFRSRRVYRHILFHRYRIIFRIQHRLVLILRVIHQSQLLLEVE